MGTAVVTLVVSTSSLRGAELGAGLPFEALLVALQIAQAAGQPAQADAPDANQTEPEADQTLAAGAGATEIPQITDEVTVTARRVEEAAQEVPIPMSVVTGEVIERAGAFNVNRLKELVPTVQFYSSNPRNSAINIRGLGSPSASPTTASSPASASTSTVSSSPVPPRPRSTSSTWSRSRCCAARRERSSARTRPPAPST